LLSLLGAVLLVSAMRSRHVVTAPFPIGFVSPTGFRSSLENLFTSLASLAGGSFGIRMDLAAVAMYGPVALTLIGLAGVLGAIYRRAVRLTRRRLSPQGHARGLYVSFWTCTLVLVVSAFVMTSTALENGGTRYLLGAWVALAALAGAFARTAWLRNALLLGVAAFGILTLRGNLVGGVPPYGAAPRQSIAEAIEHFALQHGARIGYGGYWDAFPVSVETRFGVSVIPTAACGAPSGYCRFGSVGISSWYTARPRTSTFFVTDSQEATLSPIPAPSPAFGDPEARASFGVFTVYVYRHDLATDLGVPGR
jgi:hypothetical protein